MAATTLAEMINDDDGDDGDDNDDDRDGKSSSFLKFQLTCRAPLPARPPIQTSARFYSRDRRLFSQNPQFWHKNSVVAVGVGDFNGDSILRFFSTVCNSGSL